MDLADIVDKFISWAPAALTGVLAWTAKRHLDDDDKKHGKANERLTALEVNTATTADLTRVEDRVADLQQTVSENHAELLKLLLERR